MKKLVLFAALAALSACNNETAADNTVAGDNEMVANEVVAEPAAAEMMAIDGKPDAGTYTITAADGTVTEATFNADGTLVNVTNGETVNGTWTKKGDATYCITMEGETEATCYTDTMDGTTWRSTNDADPTDTSGRMTRSLYSPCGRANSTSAYCLVWTQADRLTARTSAIPNRRMGRLPVTRRDAGPSGKGTQERND